MKIISLNQEEEIKIQIQILIHTQTQLMENQTLEMLKTLIRIKKQEEEKKKALRIISKLIKE